MNYNELNDKLKELLELERTPVAIKWSVKEPETLKKKKVKQHFVKSWTKL